jgi:hypothetical protein
MLLFKPFRHACILLLMGMLAPCATAQTSPDFVRAEAGIETVYLAWDLFPGAASYRIYFNTSGSVTTSDAFIDIANSSARGHFITGLTGGITYYYAMLALDAGSNPTPLSPEVSLTPELQYGITTAGGNGDGSAKEKNCNGNLDGTTVIPNAQPMVAYSSGYQVLITWPQQVGAGSYLVERSPVSPVSWTSVQTTSLLSLEQNLTHLTAGQEYLFRVQPQLSGACTMNPSAPVSAEIFVENPTGGGGQGDGQGHFSTCKLHLDGTLLLPASAPIRAYSQWGALQVVWPQQAGAVDYTLQRSSSGGPWTDIVTTAQLTHTQTGSDITFDQLYDFRVVANLSGGCPNGPSPAVPAQGFSDGTAASGGDGDGHGWQKTCESFPDGTGATGNSQAITVYTSTEQVLVTWPQQAGAADYTIQRRLLSGGSWQDLSTTTALLWTETLAQLSPDVFYQYRVRANLSGGCPLNPSLPVNGIAFSNTTASAGGDGDGHGWQKTCASFPDGSGASGQSQPITVYPSTERILITWPQQAGASDYTLQRSLQSPVAFSDVGTYTTLFHEEQTPTLSAGQTYLYRVRANLSGGCPIGPSPSVVALVIPDLLAAGGGEGDGNGWRKTCTQFPDGTPTVPNAEPITMYASSIDLLITWPQQAGATQYTVERSLSGGAPSWTSVATTSALAHTDAIPTVLAGTAYDYRVTPQLSGGCPMNPSLPVTGTAFGDNLLPGGGAGDGSARTLSCRLIPLSQTDVTPLGPLTACTADSLKLQLGTATSYQWYLGGQSLPGETQASITPTQSGYYRADITGAFSCTVPTDSVNVQITQTPVVPSGANANPAQLSCGPVVLSAPAAPAGVTFYWQTQYNDANLALSATQPLQVNQPGWYYLNAHNNGCWSLSSDSVEVLSNGIPAEVSSANQSGSCTVAGLDGWNYLLDGDGRAMAAIQDSGINMGQLNFNVWITGQPSNVFDGTKEFLGRHWVVSPQSQPTGQVTLRLYFSQAELNSFIIASQQSSTTSDDASGIEDLIVIKYSGPTEDGTFDLSDAVSVETLVPADTGTDLNGRYIDIVVSGFSEFWITGSGDSGPLPVTWLKQSLSCNEGTLRIELETGAEINNAGFRVEYSRDMADWIPVGWVEGMGTSASGASYSFEIPIAAESGIYYRWVQIDFDGTETAGQVLTGSCEKLAVNTLLNAGTPDGILSLSVNWQEEAVLDVEVMDAMGRRMKTKTFTVPSGHSHHSLGRADWSSGVYIISIRSSQGELISRRFVHWGS